MGREGEREEEKHWGMRNIYWLSLERPQLGTCPATRTRALAQNPTGKISVCRTPKPWSPSSQGEYGCCFKHSLGLLIKKILLLHCFPPCRETQQVKPECVINALAVVHRHRQQVCLSCQDPSSAKLTNRCLHLILSTPVKILWIYIFCLDLKDLNRDDIVFIDSLKYMKKV